MAIGSSLAMCASQILETPGHTPEGISILVFDLAKSDTAAWPC